jgi:hypothetical protein
VARRLNSFEPRTPSRPTMNSSNGQADIRTRKILFVTNSESGQANTILAMAHEAATRPHVDVHIASFPVLERRVKKLSPKLNVHPLDGEDMLEVLRAQGVLERDLPHPPTTKSFAAYGRNLVTVMVCWEGKCASCSLVCCRRYSDRTGFPV